MSSSSAASVADAEESSLGSATPGKAKSRWASDRVGLQPPVRQHQQPRPGVLLDRDGTVIIDHGYVGTIERVELIEGAAEAIATFNNAGVPVAIVTNQAGVARGYFGVDDVRLVHQHIAGKLADFGAHVDLFVYCPYHPEGVVEGFARHSEDRKPRPGMALAAAQTLNLDLPSSWVVGDSMEDIGLAKSVGATAIYVGPAREVPSEVLTFPTLAAAAPLILERVPR